MASAPPSIGWLLGDIHHRTSALDTVAPGTRLCVPFVMEAVDDLNTIETDLTG